MSRKSHACRPREVFLSHSSKDRRAASRLAAFLRAAGVRVWYSKVHIKVGQQWHDEIGSALDRCDWFLVLLSPAATEPIWVKHELVYALNDSRYREQIVPLNYKKCHYKNLSWTLGSFQSVDLTGTIKAGAEELLRRWGIESSRPVGREKPARKS